MPRSRSRAPAQESLENGSLPKGFQAEAHGQRAQLEQIAAAAPGSPSAPSSGPGAAGSTPPPLAAAPIQPFAPSAGGPQLPGQHAAPVGTDPDLLIRQAYAMDPNPDMMALLVRRGLL